MARPTSTRVNGTTDYQPPPQWSTASPLLRSSSGVRCMSTGGAAVGRSLLPDRPTPATARGVDEEEGKRGHNDKSTMDRPRPPNSVQRPTFPLQGRRKTTPHRHVGYLPHVLLVWDTCRALDIPWQATSARGTPRGCSSVPKSVSPAGPPQWFTGTPAVPSGTLPMLTRPITPLVLKPRPPVMPSVLPSRPLVLSPGQRARPCLFSAHAAESPPLPRHP